MVLRKLICFIILILKGDCLYCRFKSAPLEFGWRINIRRRANLKLLIVLLIL